MMAVESLARAFENIRFRLDRIKKIEMPGGKV